MNDQETGAGVSGEIKPVPILKLIVLRGTSRDPDIPAGARAVRFEDLRRDIVGGKGLRWLFRHREAELLTCRLPVLTKPFNSALLLRLLARGRAVMRDEAGESRAVGPGYLGGRLAALFRDAWAKRALLRRQTERVEAELASLSATRPARRLDPAGRPVYLRTDLLFAVRSGGSVTHISGVLNNLGRVAGPPLFLTTDRMPAVRPDIETVVLPPPGRFWDFAELPSVHYNEVLEETVPGIVGGRKVSFVYQRYSLDNYAGYLLSRRMSVPFVLEYNGSEIWLNRNWGKPLLHEGLAAKIETLDLRAADLVVVVSRAMKDELSGRGIDPAKVLVNPNGVDTEVYSPAVDGSGVRARHNLAGKTVVGFIGTFGRWHGAEVLAEAWGRLLKEDPDLRRGAALLMVGDGLTMPLVKEALAGYGAGDASVLTGLVPQAEGPAHLAAADILVASHVPNADGTPFFGSPTKLFEYMAMGRGIVASDLDQIGEVLRDGETALLVRPGDPDALARGIRRLIDDEALRRRLGDAARRKAVAGHTWEEHTRRIVAALKERCR